MARDCKRLGRPGLDATRAGGDCSLPNGGKSSRLNIMFAEADFVGLFVGTFGAFVLVILEGSAHLLFVCAG